MTIHCRRKQTVAVFEGEFRISDRPDLVFSTVLGSCVAVCLHDPVRRIGGMNHYLLAGGATEDESLRYGAHAMDLMIDALVAAGAERSRLTAKAFGGARITAAFADIGSDNADFARTYLARQAIPLLKADLGGLRARRLRFEPASGAARMMTVPLHNAA